MKVVKFHMQYYLDVNHLKLGRSSYKNPVLGNVNKLLKTIRVKEVHRVDSLSSEGCGVITFFN